MRSASFDVVVVGAGPAGCFAAERLAAAGWDVALVDENEGPRTGIVCSGIVGSEAFRRYDLPREAVVATIRRGRFVSPGGAEVTYEPPEEPLAYVVDRRRFDEALARRAVCAGAVLQRGHAGRRVLRSPGRIRLGTDDGGEGAEFRARALVVATGYQRWLHGPAGLGRAPGYVHGVHADLPFGRLEAAEIYLGRRGAPGYFSWAVPYGPGEARLGALAAQGGRSAFGDLVGRPEIARRLTEAATETSGTLRPDPSACLLSRGIVQGPVRPSYADRVLAVGEAAGQVKTTTGGGIYYGLIGAELAAETLDEGLRKDRLEAGFLARYEERWWRRLGGEIESGLELQRLARRVGDPQVDQLFAALQDGLGTAVRRLVRFDWHRPVLRELFRHESVRRLARGRAALAVGRG